MVQQELHRSGRAGWLRAAVLGADDGVVSTASLAIGSPPRPPRAMRCCWLGWPGWSPGRRQWRLGSTCRSAPTRRRPGRHQPGATRASRRPQVRAGRADRARCPAGTGPGAGRHRRAADGGRPAGSHVRDELGLQPGGGAAAAGGVVSAVSFAVGAALPLALIALAPIGVRISGHGAGRAGVAGPAGSGWCPAWRCPSRAAAAGDGGRGLAMALTALIGQLVGATGL